VARITRKELKTDKFALEVEQTFTFFEEHRKETVRYGAIVAALVLLGVGFFVYRNHQHALRQQELAAAIQVQEAPVGSPNPNFPIVFSTQAEKDKAALKAFAGLATKYSGTEEGIIAENYLGAIATDQGRFDEAERRFKSVASSGNKRLASLAKLSLAQLYFVQGRHKEGEVLLRDLIANPTEFVSREQATIALARALSRSNLVEARKLVEPLRTSPNSVVSVEALNLYQELASQ
jgi:predicted negative regulator of RcsB-dependent stress response